jgi:lipopolysaccharide export system permease protein
MSSLKPREGKFLFILPGIFIYIFYLSLLILSREYVSDNPNSGFALWYIHALFIILLAGYVYKDTLISQKLTKSFLSENIYVRLLLSTAILILLTWVIL